MSSNATAHDCVYCNTVVASIQGTKIYGKSSLKYVPLIGWAWMFTESIFLKREWEADKRIIVHDLKYLTEYPDNYWVTVRASSDFNLIMRISCRLQSHVACANPPGHLPVDRNTVYSTVLFW